MPKPRKALIRKFELSNFHIKLTEIRIASYLYKIEYQNLNSKLKIFIENKFEFFKLSDVENFQEFHTKHNKIILKRIFDGNLLLKNHQINFENFTTD